MSDMNITFPGGTPSSTGIPHVGNSDGSRIPPSSEKKFTLATTQGERSPADEVAMAARANERSTQVEELIKNAEALNQSQASAARNMKG